MGGAPNFLNQQLKFWKPKPALHLCNPAITQNGQTQPDTATMSDNATKAGPEPSERTAIGITFGNSNSSIAYLVDDKAEVIANEDGGGNSPHPPSK